jgi:hypothetical protein
VPKDLVEEIESVALSQGKTKSELVREALRRHLELILLEPVLTEFELVARRKLGFDDGRWQEARVVLVRFLPDRASAPIRVEPVTGDPSDDTILAWATERKATCSPRETAGTSCLSASLKASEC